MAVMEIKLTLALPRDQLSVPVVRNILKGSLQTLGIVDDTISDIEIALTEACTNVLNHADGHEEYEVSVGIEGTMCLIQVVDRGVGFDAASKGLSEVTMTAENGRGIQLMRALVDNVRFENHAEDGTIVHLEKQLVLRDDSVLRVLDVTPTIDGPWSRGVQDEAPLQPR